MQLKNVTQCTEAFKEGLKDALSVCKKLLSKFYKDALHVRQ
jgi:hypothetical protein